MTLKGNRNSTPPSSVKLININYILPNYCGDLTLIKLPDFFSALAKIFPLFSHVVINNKISDSS